MVATAYGRFSALIDKPFVNIQAAGLNHFTWMLGLQDKQTGEDLYPLFAERWATQPPEFEPLTRRVYDAFGLLPIPGDEHLAVNLPNDGYISNLPEGAIVEMPGCVSGAGVQGITVGALPEAIAELCRREITVTQLCVDAAVNGDRQAALQCLLLGPVITDLDIARQILDDYSIHLCRSEGACD